jgi:hypothetical protein
VQGFLRLGGASFGECGLHRQVDFTRQRLAKCQNRVGCAGLGGWDGQDGIHVCQFGLGLEQRQGLRQQFGQDAGIALVFQAVGQVADAALRSVQAKTFRDCLKSQTLKVFSANQVPSLPENLVKVHFGLPGKPLGFLELLNSLLQADFQNKRAFRNKSIAFLIFVKK